MRKNSAAHKKKLRSRGRGYLCAAFAAAAFVTGCGGAAHAAQQQNNSYPGASSAAPASSQVAPAAPEPGVVQAFGETAKREAQSDDPYASYWDTMLQDQQMWMKNPKYARGYDSFLAQFDQYRGEPLAQMAADVNSTVLKEITYNDTLYGKADSYWATPIETAMNREGDCKDMAILQYFIMRHLGVPENRLFVAVVSAEDKTNGIDHAVLLLNIAPAGQKENFIVLNDGGPVVNTNRYISHGKAPFKPVESCNSRECYGWFKPYVFYDARNASGFWASQYSNDTAGKRPSPAALPRRAQFSLKIGQKSGQLTLKVL